MKRLFYGFKEFSRPKKHYFRRCFCCNNRSIKTILFYSDNNSLHPLIKMRYIR